jgi:alpha/beta superfamily hydrolase
VRSLEIAGPAGRLEALLNEGSAGARFAALVCHPHPPTGGTMHNKVVYHAMKMLNDAAWGFGFPVLRFNFRGTGRSEGEYHGHDEAGDVLAALDWLENAYNLPLVLAGFSFGAMMSIAASALIGLPTHGIKRKYEYPALAKCTVPKLLLSGDRDQYATVEELEQVAALAAEPKQLVLISEADHFFTGKLEAMQAELAGWIGKWMAVGVKGRRP